MKNDVLKKLIQRIYATTEQEIDCAQTRDLLAAYVDAQVSDAGINSRYEDLRLHLNQCPDCSELYESLLQVSQLQRSSKLPSAGDLLAGLGPEGNFPSGT